MPALAPEDDEVERVCPSCRQSIAAFPDLPPASGTVAKCPEHGLAFVGRHELAASEGDPLLCTTVASRFTILARLGRGSMGAVYRARQEAVRRDVALKIVRRDRAYDPETKARFEREARAISSLTSPHTITAFDFGESEDGSWFLAMEMLDGETVGDRLRRERRMDWLDAARFAVDALKSLAEAHAKGIIHRDLKPDNLFLVKLPAERGQRREICKVLDFGIAKWQSGDQAAPIDQLETQAGTVFGTPRYMSPEQAQGSVLDARSDLYSLGVLLYQMVSGRAPFVDDDAVVVMARHIKDAPPRLAEVAPDVPIPSSLEAVLLRSLAKSPDDRPQSAEQMGAELERVLEESRALASGVQSAVVESKSRLSRPVFTALVALACLLVAALVFAVRSALGPGRAVVAAPPSAPSVEGSANAVAAPVTIVEAASAASLPEQSEISDGVDAAAAPSAREVLRSRPPRAHPMSISSGALPRKRNERYGRFE